jgi:tetratricopeptide (TPR) repeat protein
VSPAKRLDPDALVALEEERDFLLRSLDDLETERDVGDMDEADYEALKDDYTRRAAEVIRSVEAGEAAFKAAPRTSGRQVVVWLVGLAILGGLSGVLIARSSGARSSSDTITGGLRASTVSLLNQARALFADPDGWDQAVDIYDDVLEQQPSNVEALTYRGWLRYRLGGPADEALDEFDEVGRLDPGFPDAIVFNTIVLSDEGRYGEAAEVLDELDVEAAPAEVQFVIGQRGLVGEVFGEASYDVLSTPSAPTLAQLGMDVEQALAASEYLLTSDKAGRSVAALKLFRAIQGDDPDNPSALSREALLLFQASGGDPDPAGRQALESTAIVLVNRAVAANPRHPEALITRATILVESDPTTACGDLDLLKGMALDQSVSDRISDLRDRFCS